MKKVNYLLGIICMILFIASCKPKQINIKEELIPSAYLNNPTVMTFVDTTYDFGDIKQGEKVKHQFKFTNTGDHDLIIVKGYGSCGCTVPEYPKEPIKPGESGFINVQFNSKGKKDHQKKKIVLEANTKTPNFLFITANVIVDSNK